MICSPLNYVLTFSGLTEPLFALFTIGGIYLCVIRRYMAAAIVISFLPYVRSEGLIIIGVFAVYFAWKKNMKILPWLLTGSIVYAIAGYFVYEDILWVFTKIPYATLNSVYGSGDLSHFVLQFINVTGVPLYFLFWLGFLFMIVRTIKKETGPEEWALILGSFTCFFIAHSLFWYLGIFNSMGLKRVLLGVMPSAAIIALYGFNLVSEHIAVAVKWRQYLKTVIILYVLVFPFLPNPSAIQWQKDMRLDNAQIQVKELATFIKTHSSTYPFLYNYYYLGVVFDIDHFDLNQHRFISRESVQAMQPGNILIWDNLYAGKESDIHKREIDSLPELQILKSFSTRWAGEEMQFVIYRRK
jgi:hypothetical protein